MKVEYSSSGLEALRLGLQHYQIGLAPEAVDECGAVEQWEQEHLRAMENELLAPDRVRKVEWWGLSLVVAEQIDRRGLCFLEGASLDWEVYVDPERRQTRRSPILTSGGVLFLPRRG